MTEETEKPATPTDGGLGRPSILLGTAHLAALWALAIVQPMLSLLGNTPEFFVARNNTAGQVILYGLVLAFGPPLIAFVIEFVAERIGPRVRWAIHLGLMALVGTALVLGILKKYVDIPAGALIGLSLALASVGVYAYARFRFPRAFMDILTPAPIVILLLFVFFSPASKVIFPTSEPDPIEIEIENPSPVFFIVFDEFPLATLLETPTEIDSSRYPNFSDLASQSTWYPNASAAAAYTPFALPAILAGRNPDLEDLPVSGEYPESIFTLLGRSYDFRVDERLTRICPESLCPERPGDSDYDNGTGALFSDLFVVSGHLLLPNSLREGLPDISSTFGGFGEGADANADDEAGATTDRAGDGDQAADLANAFGTGERKSVEDQVAAFGEEVTVGERPLMGLIHLLKPHIPWKHIPDGQRYSNLPNEWMDLSPEFRRWETPQKVVDVALQRALLEVGYTDTLLGRLKESLEEKGLWEESLVVVTADHGAGFRSRDERRRATKGNLGEVASVPLFIKAPGQNEPEVVERHTCLTSVVSRTAALLGIDYPWSIDECPPNEVRVAGPPNGLTVGSVATMKAQRNRLLSRIERLYTTGTGWRPVYRSGPRRELIGRSVRSFDPIPVARDQRAIPETPNALEDYAPDEVYLRGLLQRGLVRGLGKDEVIAIALNGRIAAVGWTFDDRARPGIGYSILLDPKTPEKGFNRLEVFRVGSGGKGLQKLFPVNAKPKGSGSGS